MSSFFQKVRNRLVSKNDAEPAVSTATENELSNQPTRSSVNVIDEVPESLPGIIQPIDNSDAYENNEADEIAIEHRRHSKDAEENTDENEDQRSQEVATQDQPKLDETNSDAASIVPDEPEPSKFRDDLYIQMRQNFRRTTREAFAINQLMSEIPPLTSAEMQHYRSVSTAISIQTVFHNFALVLQGLLSGLAVFHSIVAFVFTDINAMTKEYKQMAAPMHAVFYFCFVVTAIGAMDRFETGGSWRHTIDRCMKLQRGGLALLIAFIGTSSTAAMTKFEEYLTMQLPDILEPNSSLVIAWRWLSFTRAVCAVCSWLLIALQPTANYTRDQLLAMAPQLEMQVDGLETDISSENARIANRGIVSLANSAGGLNLSQELIASMRLAAQKSLPNQSLS
ncbi:Transmembrane protein [Aphelenchoides besseyi]|nr:Transmembrane protein [Aphelenchoides besseyi]